MVDDHRKQRHSPTLPDHAPALPDRDRGTSETPRLTTKEAVALRVLVHDQLCLV
jgi:hypothetical protein